MNCTAHCRNICGGGKMFPAFLRAQLSRPARGHRPPLPGPGAGATDPLWARLNHSPSGETPSLFYWTSARSPLLCPGELNQLAARSDTFREVQRGTGERGEERRGSAISLGYLEELHPWVYPSPFLNWVFIWTLFMPIIATGFPSYREWWKVTVLCFLPG